jgi:anti-sigma factor RsiW
MKRGWIRIPCGHAQELLSERMDGRLPPGRRWRLRLHLAFCDACSRVERQLALIRSAMRQLGS